MWLKFIIFLFGFCLNSFASDKLILNIPLTKKSLTLQKNHTDEWVSPQCAALKNRCPIYFKNFSKKELEVDRYNGVSGEAHLCTLLKGDYQIGIDLKGNEWGICLVDELTFFDASILLKGQE